MVVVWVANQSRFTVPKLHESVPTASPTRVPAAASLGQALKVADYHVRAGHAASGRQTESRKSLLHSRPL